MNTLKSLFVISLFSVSSINFAQAPGDPDIEFQQIPVSGNEVQEEKDVVTIISDFLEEKRWVEGDNVKGEKKFYVAVGTGVISAPRTHPQYIASRAAAFEKALMAAKQQMVEYLGTEIATATLKTYSEGDFNAEAKRIAELEEAKKELSILDKARILVHKKLDDQLKKDGVDTDKKLPAELLKKAISSDSFKKFTSTVARARLTGLQAYKFFEYCPEGGKGTIGVVCIHSDKLQEMAKAIVDGSDMPKGKARKPIKEQLPNDLPTLLCSYGVQQKYDENGNLVLIAYAQAQPLTSSVKSIGVAYDKAKISAMSMIRQFAGENVVAVTDMLQAESSKEFEDKTEVYNNDSAYAQRISTISESMNISGISIIKRWSGKHPLTNGTVCGVVCSWSPQSSSRAQSLKEAMSPVKTPSSGNDGGKGKGEGEASKTNKLGKEKGNYQGSGAEADDDAF